jgi:hypothetical protein
MIGLKLIKNFLKHGRILLKKKKTFSKEEQDKWAKEKNKKELFSEKGGKGD